MVKPRYSYALSPPVVEDGRSRMFFRGCKRRNSDEGTSKLWNQPRLSSTGSVAWLDGRQGVTNLLLLLLRLSALGGLLHMTDFR